MPEGRLQRTREAYRTLPLMPARCPLVGVCDSTQFRWIDHVPLCVKCGANWYSGYRVATLETAESRHIREHYIEPIGWRRPSDNAAEQLQRGMTANVIEGDQH